MSLLRKIVLLSIFLLPSLGSAFEVVNDHKSYENDRFFSFNLGLGMNQFTNSNGVSGVNPGLAFQTSIGHRFNQWLGVEGVYQLSTIRMFSPDPIAPGSDINTRVGINQEYLRLKLYYPRVVAQPYIGAGFGSYQFFGVNAETAFSFPAGWEVPLSAGFQTFISGNSISLDFDFTYHMFMGENQDATTLGILGVSEISFDMYSLIGSFTFHFF
jgi:hypothetical protein